LVCHTGKKKVGRGWGRRRGRCSKGLAKETRDRNIGWEIIFDCNNH
jgi:hypothetical protein